MKLRVNPKMLAEVLTVAAAFADAEAVAVDLAFYPKANFLGVLARNAQGQTFDAIVVCLSPPK